MLSLNFIVMFFKFDTEMFSSGIGTRMLITFTAKLNFAANELELLLNHVLVIFYRGDSHSSTQTDVSQLDSPATH